jgi:hypothetical protein
MVGNMLSKRVLAQTTPSFVFSSERQLLTFEPQDPQPECLPQVK